MGILVQPKSYQDKIVKGNPDYDTLEVQNYIYTVTNPSLEDLNPTQPWADLEFKERVSPLKVNPGRAWKSRREVWEEFLHCPEECGELPAKCPHPCETKDFDGYFDYTYNQRMRLQLEDIIQALKNDPESRQLYLSIWHPGIDPKKLGGKARIPCSLGYLFQYRRGVVDMTYMMRSSDLITHFENDIYLARKLQEYVAKKTGFEPGIFTHYIGSLHVFRKDVVGVF